MAFVVSRLMLFLFFSAYTYIIARQFTNQTELTTAIKWNKWTVMCATYAASHMWLYVISRNIYLIFVFYFVEIKCWKSDFLHFILNYVNCRLETIESSKWWWVSFGGNDFNCWLLVWATKRMLFSRNGCLFFV